MKSRSKLLASMLSVGLLLLSVAALSSCGGTSSENTAYVTVGMSLGGQAAKFDGSFSHAGHVAVDAVSLTTVKLVLGQLEIDKSTDDSTILNGNIPLIGELDMEGGLVILATYEVPAGTYSGIKFNSRALEESDGDYYINNPELQNASIYVEGYVNGTVDSSFVWTSGLPRVIMLSTTSLNLEPGDSVLLDITVDTDSWFATVADGFYDPRLDDVATTAHIENNIFDSFDVTVE